MVVRERRCVKCQAWTGIRPDGTFVEYTFHPHVVRLASRPVEAIAVFCANCFDVLGSAGARDAAAAGAPREVLLSAQA